MWADRGALYPNLPPPSLPTRQKVAPVLSRSTSLSSRPDFKLQGLQSPLKPPRCLTQSLGPLTSCNCSLQHHTTPTVKRREKCKQRGGLDVPLTLLANYPGLQSAIGFLKEESGSEVKHHRGPTAVDLMFCFHAIITNTEFFVDKWLI